MRFWLFFLAWMTAHPAFGLVVEVGPQAPERASSPALRCASLLVGDWKAPSLDLRRYLGREPALFQALVIDRSHAPILTFDIGYESEVGETRNQLGHFRSIVRELVRRAQESGQEVGALVFESPGFEPIVVFFSSEAHTHIDGATHQEAWRRLLEEIRRPKGGEPVDLNQVSIQEFHTHPEDASGPHSGADILQDIRTESWLRKSFLKNARFSSTVIPMAYGGSLYCQFEPRRHRIY